MFQAVAQLTYSKVLEVMSCKLDDERSLADFARAGVSRLHV